MASRMPDIIVLLPGILGSVLKKDGRTAWGFSGRAVGSALVTGGRSIREALALAGDSPDPDVDLGDGVTVGGMLPDLHLIPGLWKIDGYSRIAARIAAAFEVQKGRNFFEFPYDWRRDNRVAARQLARESHVWLREWRASHRDARLILIAHSMGGLVARYFLEVLGGWKDTRALITFGTPFRGSLNALDTLANGVRKGPLELAQISALARSLTSVHQLLPIYPAYDPGDGRLLRVGSTAGIPNVDAEAARAALDFHDEIWSAVEQNRRDPQWAEHGYDLYPVLGVEQATLQLGRRDGDRVAMLETYEGRDLGGDGTVPRVSALPRELRANQVDMYAATRHAALQNADAVLTHVESRIHDFYLDFGRFKSAPFEASGAVGIQAPDLLFDDEPIEVRARTGSESASLRASLLDGEGRSVGECDLPAPGSDDGDWRLARFQPQPAGRYVVRVSGAGVTLPAEDAISIAQRPAHGLEQPDG